MVDETIKAESIKTIVSSIDPNINKILNENELKERKWWLDHPNALGALYPSLNDPNFNLKIAQKKEFNDTQFDGQVYDLNERAKNLCLSEFELASHQQFVRNFLSFQTPYNSLLLYHGLGTGKTCSAIGIAEEMRDYIKQIGTSQRIMVIASPNVQDNFKLQLFDESKLILENGIWNLKTCVGSKLLKEVNPLNQKGIPKSKIITMIKTIINNSYVFMGYGEFANSIEKHSDIQSMLIKDKDKIIKKRLNDFFNNRLIIIDEVHNLRISDDKKGKKIAEQITKLVKNVDNLRLLFLSATPLYNSYKEIIDLINIMNENDNRSTIQIKDVFDQNGDFIAGGQELLERKSIGYISFVKGDNPYTFPFRVWPDQFFKEKSLKELEYPKFTITGDRIGKKLNHLSIYINELSPYQSLGYQFIVNSLPSSSEGIIRNLDSLGYIELQKPLEALNIVYPNLNLYENQLDADIQVEDLVGKNGLNKIMNYKTTITPPFKGDFDYKPEILSNFDRIFSKDNISMYSSKIASICENIMNSEGVCLIYTHYVDGGVVPIALALEELGITRYGDTPSLFSKPPILPLDLTNYTNNNNKNSIPAKYIAISGDRSLSPNNKNEIAAATSPSNISGNNVKVIIITQAGSEGIDFKFVRQVHIMEPWYNLSRIEQIIGRGVRNCSHILLPFEKRNVEIFLYGSFLIDNQEEAADLYVYRIAEDKAEKIGKVTRVLKEVSVDCQLNQSQNNFSADIFQKDINIKLSNGKTILYTVGDKPYSAQCDYMESCFYKCKPTNIIDDVNNLSNSEFFVYSNNDVITKRIKQLFSERYFYNKESLISSINIVKKYPTDQIYAALSSLIDDKSDYLIDKYNRLGNLVNIGDMYFFQPIELKNTNISIFERSVPISKKHLGIPLNPQEIVYSNLKDKSKISIKPSLKLSKPIVQESKSTSQESKSISEESKLTQKDDTKEIDRIEFKEGQKVMRTVSSQFYTSKEKHKIVRGETDWYKYASGIIKLLEKLGKNLKMLEEIVLFHSLDMLLQKDTLNLLNYIYNLDSLSQFEIKIKSYFDSKLLIKGDLKGILIENWDDKKKKSLSQLYIFKEGRFVLGESEDYEDLKDMILKMIIPKSNWNEIIGFISNFKNLLMVFKIKDNKPGTLGARCDQGGKTNASRLNYLLGRNYFSDEDVKSKSIIELCVLQEFLMRIATNENRDNKVWFLNAIQFILSS